MSVSPARPEGVVLARRGDIDFIRVDAVLAIHGDQVAFSCDARAWEQSAEARAAKLDAAIAEAQARLEVLLRERGSIHALGDIRPIAQLEAAPKKARRRYRCLGCGNPISNFTLHAKKAHPDADPEALRGPEIVEAELGAGTPASVPAEAAQADAGGPEGQEQGKSTPLATEALRGEDPK